MSSVVRMSRRMRVAGSAEVTVGNPQECLGKEQLEGAHIGFLRLPSAHALTQGSGKPEQAAGACHYLLINIRGGLLGHFLDERL